MRDLVDYVLGARGRMREAGIVIGHDWPAPLVDLAEGRARALAAFAAIKGGEAA